MKQRRLKRTMVPVVYTIAIVAVLGIAYMIEGAISNNQFKDEDHYGYVSKTIFDDSEAVVATETKVMRPYLDSELQIVKSYYDYKADATSQENALISTRILICKIVVFLMVEKKTLMLLQF